MQTVKNPREARKQKNKEKEEEKKKEKIEVTKIITLIPLQQKVN